MQTPGPDTDTTLTLDDVRALRGRTVEITYSCT